MKKTILSFVLALLMIVTSMPITANAANTPRLVYRFARYDEKKQVHYEDLSDWLHDEMNTHAGNGSPVTLYFVDANGNETRLSASDVTSSDTNILTFEADQDAPEVLHLRYCGLGTAYLNYVHTDQQTYSITFNVDLPLVGFYTTQTAAGYVSEYTVTETGSNVLYLISTYGDIDSVDLNENFDRIATMRQISSTVYEVQITGTPSQDYWYSADVFVKNKYNSGRIDNFGASINLINAKSALMVSYSDWNNGVPTPNPHLESYVHMAKGYSHDVYAYFVDKGVNKSLLNAGNLTSSNPDVVTIGNNEQYGDMVRLNAVDFGTAKITYTHTNGQTYSFDVTVDLPNVGFYTTTTASKNSYITEFDVTENGPNVVYLVSRYDKMNKVTLWDGLEQIATATLSSDGLYATITITGTPKDRWGGAEVEITRDNGWSSNYGVSLQLNNKKTSLAYTYMSWNNGVLSPDQELRYELNLAKGYSNDICVYFVEQGTNRKLMKAESLKSSNPNVVVVESREGQDDIVRLRPVDFGTAQISYTHTNGQTYSFDVEVILPDVGFYTTTTASQSSYITEFDVTDNGSNVIYYVSRFNKMNNITLSDELAEIATAVLSSDGTYATINITGTPSNRWYDVQTEITNDNGRTGRYGASVRLNNKKTSLMFGFAEWNNNIPSPNQNNLRSSVNMCRGDSWVGYVYFMEQGTNQNIVKVGSLTSSNPNVVTVETFERYDDMVRLQSVGFGTATITYTHTDGQTYSFDVTVELPDVGFYTTPTVSQSSHITEFTVSDNSSNVIYLVTDRDSIKSITLRDEFGRIANAVLSSDGTYATITITGTPTDRWYEAEVELQNRDGGTYTYGCSIILKDGNPYIGLCWPDDESASGHGYPNRFLDTAVGYSTDVWLYLIEGNTETLLGASDVKSTNENVIKVVDTGYTNGMVRLETVGWGIAAISYTHNGTTYYLNVLSDTQTFGYYTENIISRENWIRGFEVTEEDNTFYFMADYGYTFEQLMPTQDLADIAQIERSADKTWVKITVTGEPVENGFYGFDFEFAHPDGGRGEGREILDSIKDLRNKVEFEDVVAGSYYETPVQWAVEKGITNGYGSETTFCPDMTCTRGQVVTFLWRAKGCPEPASSVNPFTDIKESDYYYKAVLWAVENGITSGYGSSTIFNPDGACTRGQVATFLWRAEGEPSMSGAANPFTDVAPGTYYYDAVLWAVANGVTNGYGGSTTFAPDEICNRGQIVTFLYRAEEQ